MERVLILGVNNKSIQFSNFIKKIDNNIICGFADIESSLAGKEINFLRIYNFKKINELEKVITDLKITKIYIADQIKIEINLEELFKICLKKKFLCSLKIKKK